MTSAQLDLFAPAVATPHTATLPPAPADPHARPPGWQWVKLGDVVAHSPEKYQPKDEQAYYVGLEHIEKESGLISDSAEVELINTIKNRFKKGDILYGKLRPYLNKVALATRDGVCSTDILVLRPEPNVVAKYVHFFMLRHAFVNDMQANTMGVNLPRVPTKYVLSYPFPLPPLAEQQRIVARIDALFSEIDAGVAEVETALQRLKTYRQAVLHYFLSNDTWERVKLGEVCELITKGSSPKWQGFEYVSDDNQTLFVTSENIRENFIDVTQPKYLNSDFNNIQKRSILKYGDVLLNIVGASIGRAAIYNIHTLANINQAVALIRIDSASISNVYLSYFLNSSVASSFYNLNKVDVARANLSLKDVANIPIPLPDLATQTRVVQDIEARLSEADALEKTLRLELQRAGRLRQSVLQQAFSGGLT